MAKRTEKIAGAGQQPLGGPEGGSLLQDFRRVEDKTGDRRDFGRVAGDPGDPEAAPESPQITEWIERLDQVRPEAFLEPPASGIRCIYHTAVVVEATPSGRRYEFQPGQVRGDVDPDDVVYLLGLAREQRPCCPGGEVRPIKYFELA